MKQLQPSNHGFETKGTNAIANSMRHPKQFLEWKHGCYNSVVVGEHCLARLGIQELSTITMVMSTSPNVYSCFPTRFEFVGRDRAIMDERKTAPDVNMRDIRLQTSQSSVRNELLGADIL